MHPFRLIPTLRRSPFGGWYLRVGRTRRLLHVGNWGRLLSVTEVKS